MNDHDKIIKMFTIIHGDFEHYYAEVTEDEYTDEIRIHLIKDGKSTWSVSLAELTFDYITRDWQL